MRLFYEIKVKNNGALKDTNRNNDKKGKKNYFVYRLSQEKQVRGSLTWPQGSSDKICGPRSSSSLAVCPYFDGVDGVWTQVPDGGGSICDVHDVYKDLGGVVLHSYFVQPLLPGPLT